jgi:hypothetical protein
MAREKLKPRQARFVRNLLAGMRKAQAAIEAGYEPSNADNTAARLQGYPHVAAAIRDGAEARLKAGAHLGVRALLDLVENAASEDVRLRAATALLDRGGMPLVKQSEVHPTVTDRRTDRELLEHARQLAKQLGVAMPAGIVDADFAPVERPALPAPAAEPVAKPVTHADVFGDDE